VGNVLQKSPIQESHQSSNLFASFSKTGHEKDTHGVNFIFFQGDLIIPRDIFVIQLISDI